MEGALSPPPKSMRIRSSKISALSSQSSSSNPNVRRSLQLNQIENENQNDTYLNTLSDPASTPPRPSRRRGLKPPLSIESSLFSPPLRESQKRCPPTPRKSFNSRRTSLSKGGDDGESQGALFVLNPDVKLEEFVIDSTHFTRLEQIGTGEFGEVWKGKFKKTGDHFAIKQSHLHRPVSKAQIHHHVAVLKRLAEQTLLADLEKDGFETPFRKPRTPTSWHPNILRHECVWREQQDGVVFVQTELCNCQLKEYVSNELSQGTLKEADFFKILVQIASALSFMHAHGLVHMDVKPDNILARHDASPEEQEFVLGDLGSAVFMNEKKNLEEGDSRYLAPEVLREGKATGGADVFSLGLSLYELLTGAELPPNGDQWKQFRSVETRAEMEEKAKAESLRNSSASKKISSKSRYLGLHGILGIDEQDKKDQDCDDDQKDHPPSSFLKHTIIRVSPLLKRIIWRMINPNPEKRLAIPGNLHLLNGGVLEQLEGDSIWKQVYRFFLDSTSQSCSSSAYSSSCAASVCAPSISHTAPTRFSTRSPSISYIEGSPPNSPRSRAYSPSFFDHYPPPPSLSRAGAPTSSPAFVIPPVESGPSSSTLPLPPCPILPQSPSNDLFASPSMQGLSVSGGHISSPPPDLRIDNESDPMSMERAISPLGSPHSEPNSPRGSLFDLSPRSRSGSVSRCSKSRSLFDSTVRPRLGRNRAKSWYQRPRSPHSPESPSSPTLNSKSTSPQPINQVSPLRSARGKDKTFFDAKSSSPHVTPPRKLRTRRSFASLFDEDEDVKSDYDEPEPLPEYLAPTPKSASKKLLDLPATEIEMCDFAKDFDGGEQDSLEDELNEPQRMDTDTPTPTASVPQSPQTPRSLSFSNAFSLPRSLSNSFPRSLSKLWQSDILAPLRGSSFSDSRRSSTDSVVKSSPIANKEK